MAKENSKKSNLKAVPSIAEKSDKVQEQLAEEQRQQQEGEADTEQIQKEMDENQKEQQEVARQSAENEQENQRMVPQETPEPEKIEPAPAVEPAPPGITQDEGPDPNDPRLQGSDTEKELVDKGDYTVEDYIATLEEDYKSAEPLFFREEGEADTWAGQIRKAGFECVKLTGAKDNQQGWKVFVTNEYKTVHNQE